MYTKNVSKYTQIYPRYTSGGGQPGPDTNNIPKKYQSITKRRPARPKQRAARVPGRPVRKARAHRRLGSLKVSRLSPWS